MCAFANLEPCGFEIENFRAGVVASTVASVHGNKTKPKDFYPKIGRSVGIDQQSKEDQMRILMATSKPSKAN